MVQTVHDIIIRLKQEGMNETAKAVQQLGPQLKNLKKGETAVASGTKIMNQGVQKATIVFKRNKKGILEVSKSLTTNVSNMRRFRMEWLSVMFFSMNVSRRLRGIMMGSVSTLTKIAGKNNEAAQTVAALSAQFTYLKFAIGSAIGEALQPYMPIIAKFVDKMVEFIEQHPDLVFKGLVGAFVIFAGLNIAGQLALVATGFMQIATNAMAAKTAVMGFKTLGAIATATIGLYIAYGGIKDIIKGISEADWKTILKGILTAGVGGALVGAAAAIALGTPLLASAVIGATVAVSIGLILAFYIKDTKRIERLRARGLSEKDIAQLKIEEIFGIDTGISGFARMQREVDDFLQQAKNSANETSESWQNSWRHALGKYKLSTPLGWLLLQVSQEWINMANVATSQIDRIIAKINTIPREIVTTVRIRTIGGGIGVRGFATGTDYVPKTGMYLLHRGEQVIPNNITNNVNVNVSGNQNANAIAQAISEELNKKLRRYI